MPNRDSSASSATLIDTGPDDTSPTKVVKSPIYFLEGALFQVENTLYKIPGADITAASPIFNDMFQLPSGKERKPEGVDEDNPIRLEGIKKIDWERLLKVMLHKSFVDPPLSFASLEEWTSVLKLATMWEMDAIREFAITKIDLFDEPASKIMLARAHTVPTYFLPCIARLILRSDPLSLRDLECLGAESALKIASIRERVRENYRSDRGDSNDIFWSRRGWSEDRDVRKEIFAVFTDHVGYNK